MLILGLWHEISIRYILWALLHAFAINVWYKYEATNWHKNLKVNPVLKQLIGMVITLNFVMLSFVLVSENSLYDSFKVLRILFFLK